MTSSALLLLAVGVAVSGGVGARSRRQLRSLRPPPARPPRTVGRPAAVVLAALGAAVLLGGAAGVLGAVLAGAAAHRGLRKLEPAANRRLRRRRAAQLPIALDLLAVCLRAGAPLVTALAVVADALTGPLAADLAVVGGLQQLGAAPAAAWSRYEKDPVLAPVVRSVYRSARSGSALAAAFERLAAERRVAALADGESLARRAGVLAVAPLGGCFLPAFVCLGILPLVLSIAGTVFG